MRKLVLSACLLSIASTASALDATLTATVEGGDKPVVIGKTNLPDETQLMVDVRGDKIPYWRDVRAQVVNGEFHAGPFTRRGASLKPGTYAIRVVSPLGALQPLSVQGIIGENGQRLQGPLTRRNTLGGMSIDYQTTFSVAGAPVETTDPADMPAQSGLPGPSGTDTPGSDAGADNLAAHDDAK